MTKNSGVDADQLDALLAAQEKEQTLNDVLKNIDEEELVHLGVASGYVFVGKKEQLNNVLDKLDFEAYMDYKDKMLSLERDIVAQTYRLEENINRIKAAQEEITKNFEKITANLNKAGEKYVHLKDRPVKDKYERITEGISILLDGDEAGEFWDRSEYNAWKRKNQIEAAAIKYHTVFEYMKKRYAAGDNTDEIFNTALTYVGMKEGK